jgi:hypothetical protein
VIIQVPLKELLEGTQHFQQLHQQVVVQVDQALLMAQVHFFLEQEVQVEVVVEMLQFLDQVIIHLQIHLKEIMVEQVFLQGQTMAQLEGVEQLLLVVTEVQVQLELEVQVHQTILITHPQHTQVVEVVEFFALEVVVQEELVVEELVVEVVEHLQVRDKPTLEVVEELDQDLMPLEWEQLVVQVLLF